MEQKEVDKKIFSMSLALVAVFTVPTLINPEKGVHFLNAVLSFLIVNLGYFYLWGAFSVFVIVMYLCFSKYGKIKLGDSEPEFSTFSWIGMIFTATAGSSLVYWGFTEWIYYYTSPPFGMEPRSAEAAEWASTYGMYHWGVMGFVIYCLPTIVLAYAMYVRNLPSIRLSNACRGVLGDRVDGWVGQLIDVMFMFGIVGGIGTSLGLGTPMLAQGISELTGIPRSYKLDVAIIEMVKIMPLGEGVLLGLFVVFNFIFLSTTMDSAAYSLAFISSKASNVNQEPARWISLFWAMVLGAVAIILFYGGGLKALQTLSIITGFPILLIFIFFVMTIFKWLKEDFPQEIMMPKSVKDKTSSESLSTEKLSA